MFLKFLTQLRIAQMVREERRSRKREGEEDERK
jgi:hypothetical protein